MLNTSGTDLVLHVGLPKTATTTIQRALFACHPDVYYLGKIVDNRNDPGKRCLDSVTFKILNRLLWKLERPLNVEKTRKVLEEELLPSVPAGRTLVASWEELGHRTTPRFAEMIKRVKSVFGGCRVIYTLRNPLEQLPSEYLQNLRGHFVKREKVWMGLSSYMDIESWYRRRELTKARFAPLHNYPDCIRVARELLGEENVGVFLFEDLKRNPEGYYRAVCSFAGIDPEIGVSLTEKKHLHARLSMAQVRLMQEIDDSWLRRSHVLFMSEKKRRRLLMTEAGGPPAKAELTESLAAKIIEASGEGHRWLSETLGLPLEEYGYPMS